MTTAAKSNQHPEDIKAAVRKTGVSLAELARHTGISDSTARKALYLPRPSGNRAIAQHLGKSLNEIWPEWFDGDGNRISWPKHTVTSPCTASQKRRAG